MSLLQRKGADVDAHDFQLQVEPDGDAMVVSVAGELDLATVPALRGALVGAVERGATRVVLDLTAVTFIDSVGIGAVLHAKRRLRPHGTLAVVVAPDSYARVIFEVVGADKVLPVCPTRAGAVAALA